MYQWQIRMEVQMVKETGGEEHRFSMKDPIKRKNS